jgi:hypothetical protein
VRRREFITLLGGAAAAWPLAARAQSAKLPTVGFLGTSTPAAWSQWTAAFVRRLSELGWIEGRTVAIEYRWYPGGPRWGWAQSSLDQAARRGCAPRAAQKRGVQCAPVSAPKFPDNREINREFFNFGANCAV